MGLGAVGRDSSGVKHVGFEPEAQAASPAPGAVGGEDGGDWAWDGA